MKFKIIDNHASQANEASTKKQIIGSIRNAYKLAMENDLKVIVTVETVAKSGGSES